MARVAGPTGVRLTLLERVDTVHPAVTPIPPIRAPHRLLRVLAAVCMVAALVVAAPATSGAAPRPIGPLSPGTGAWFGATVNPDRGDGVGGGMGEIGARESFLGRRYDIINRFYAFDEAIPTSLESWDASMGRIPMITWGAGADTIELRTGVHDAWLRAQADRLAAFGEPIFLRYYHEMEAGYRSSEVHSAADMIAAWRHVHEVFQQRGATNVVWVWCPTAWSFVTRSPWPPDYYPGDAYVDWIAADGYNWYPRPGSQWRSFTQVFDPFYDWASTKTKPIMIAENGVMEDPAQAARKAAWITSSRDLLPSAYPMIEAILYFDTQMTRNGFTHTWPVDTSQNAYNAYRAMGQDPYFNPPHGSGGGIRRGRYAIGDSVMQSASRELRNEGIRVDVAANRRFASLPALIRSLRNSGALRKTVIIHLGNNSPIRLADCRASVRAAAGRRIFLVTVTTPRSWRQENNRRLDRCDRAFSRAHLLDWFTHSAHQPAWFIGDRHHLTPLGQRRYATFIDRRTG